MRFYFLWFFLWMTILVFSLWTPLLAQGSVASPTQTALPSYDVKAATNAYLATITTADRLRSNAYFEGGYWIQLWDFLLSTAIMLLLLSSGLSRKMREGAERISRFKPIQNFIYYLQFALLTTILGFPLTLYESFFRERQYGLMNQTLGGWMGDYLKMMGVSLLLGGAALVILFGIVRKLERSWHLWGAVFSILFLAFVIVISPVYISPLVNQYKKLADPKVREPILKLARANGVPATEVYEFDASRQSKRISANVSGFLGTERISLNDNLLNRCTPAEIKAVMAHEIGHYVLNHVWKGLMFFSILCVLFFTYLRWALAKCLTKWGSRWGIRAMGDTAILPLVMLLASLFFFVTGPVNVTFTRVQEAEADLFGLNAAREPDAEARVDLMLGEYRKLDPTPLEEFLFFDHPSGRSRIAMAMQWKAEHLEELRGMEAE
jgi:STE24 endopeptidase